jgi:hypothetical protein
MTHTLRRFVPLKLDASYLGKRRAQNEMKKEMGQFAKRHDKRWTCVRLFTAPFLIFLTLLTFTSTSHSSMGFLHSIVLGSCSFILGMVFVSQVVSRLLAPAAKVYSVLTCRWTFPSSMCP